jgi:protein-S-isoprenylcysteine O-methyltransferase Ste14
MKKYLTAMLFVVALSAVLAAPALAAEEPGEAKAGTGDIIRKEIKVTAPGDDEEAYLEAPEGMEELEPGKKVVKEQVLIPLVAMTVPVFTIIGAALVLIIAIWMAHRTAKMRYELIQVAIKEGKEIPPELLRDGFRRRRRDPLLAGLILTGGGIGVTVALGAVAGWIQGLWGLIPLLVGVAFLIYVPFWRKQKKEDENR